VALVGNDVICPDAAQQLCDGTWHRVAFGWGQTFVRLGTVLRDPPGATVVRLSPIASDDDARTVWNYEGARWECLGCGETI
jgi:hypothetical protein